MRTCLRGPLMTASLAAAGGAWSAGLNLLPDGGFELGQWEVTSWDAGVGKHEFAFPGRTGDHCLHLVGTSAAPGKINQLGISPAVRLPGPGKYVYAVWYRTTGDPRAFLGFMTFSQPFATAQWKTPQVQYEALTLDDSRDWRLAVWQFEVPPQALEMRALLRLAGVGEVWYDDASLVRASDCRLEPLRAGQVRALPQTRAYDARVIVPKGRRWTLTLIGPDGKPAASVGGARPKPEVSLRFAAPAGQSYRALLDAEGALVGCDDFVTPELAELRVDTCRYRNSVYASSPPQALRGALVVNAADAVRKTMRYRVGTAAGSAATGGKWLPVKAASTDFAVDLAALTPGHWKVWAEVEGAGAPLRLEAPLQVQAPGKPHEVIIDDANRLLVDGRPFFAAGFYGVPAKDDLARPTAQAGYNVALTYDESPESCRAWLDMCGRIGLRGIVSVPRPFVDHFDAEKLRQALRVVKDHPALLAYYLIDEPSPQQPNQKPEDLQRVYDVIRDEDPYHPVTICICSSELERTYLSCYDVLMIDVYPVAPHGPSLTTIADRMEHAWAATDRRRPVWFIAQTFGYDIVEGLGKEPSWITATPAQERVMQYLALAHGARGMVPYCYHVYTRYDAEAEKAGRWPWVLGGYLPERQPVLWGELAQLGREYQAIAPALLQPQHQAQVLDGGKLHVGWYHDGKSAWVVAVNADSKDPARAAVPTPPGLPPPKSVGDLGLGASATVKAGGLYLELPPLGSLVVAVRF